MENHFTNLTDDDDHQQLFIKTEVWESAGPDIDIKDDFHNTNAKSLDFEESQTNMIKKEETSDSVPINDYVVKETNAQTTHQSSEFENSQVEINNETVINEHQIIKLRPFKCSKCPYRSHAYKNIHRHELIHQEVKPFECDKCSFKTRRNADLKNHQKTHTREQLKPFKCTICRFSTHNNRSLKHHQLIHQDTRFQCDKCSFKTRRKYELTRHQIFHKVTSDGNSFKCTKCNFATKYKNYLSSHIRRHHLEMTLFECDKCSYKGRKRDLKIHQLIHEEDIAVVKPFECDKCSYRGRKVADLGLHQLIHEDMANVKPFECDKCPYKGRRNVDLKRHQITHENVNSDSVTNLAMQANEADKETSESKSDDDEFKLITPPNSGNLKNEIEQQHEEDELLQCDDDIYECDYNIKDTTINAHQLTQFENNEVEIKNEPLIDMHQMSDRELKPFRCTQCSFRTHYQGLLNRHLKVHTDVKPFECDKCPFKTRRKYVLTRHLAKHVVIAKVESFRCTKCDYVTMNKNEFDIHQSVHDIDLLELETFMCRFCHFETKNIGNMKNHMLITHDIID